MKWLGLAALLGFLGLLVLGYGFGVLGLFDDLSEQRERGWQGFIVPIPNCTTTGLAVTLKPLYDVFGLQTVLMTSMQAISGAGRRGGQAS